MGICTYCGGEYKAVRKKQRFCKSLCRMRWHLAVRKEAMDEYTAKRLEQETVPGNHVGESQGNPTPQVHEGQ